MTSTIGTNHGTIKFPSTRKLNSFIYFMLSALSYQSKQNNFLCRLQKLVFRIKFPTYCIFWFFVFWKLTESCHIVTYVQNYHHITATARSFWSCNFVTSLSAGQCFKSRPRWFSTDNLPHVPSSCKVISTCRQCAADGSYATAVRELWFSWVQTNTQVAVNEAIP